MNLNDVQPAAMSDFCLQVLPAMLREACGVDPALAEAIGQDTLTRAEDFSALDPISQAAISAPFVEQVAHYEPVQASRLLKAAVCVVVRNSQLEEAHAHGPVNDGGIKGITTMAATPLSHFLAAHRHSSKPSTGTLFVDLKDRFPRAWAALAALSTALETGGRVSYRKPDAPLPDMPSLDAAVTVARTHDDRAVVQSAIDTVLNRALVEKIHRAVDQGGPFYVPNLGRLSRNSGILLSLIEILLSRDVPIVTTNYLIRPEDVWVRKGELVQPDYNPPFRLEILDGLSGSHRKMVEAIKKLVDNAAFDSHAQG